MCSSLLSLSGQSQGKRSSTHSKVESLGTESHLEANPAICSSEQGKSTETAPQHPKQKQRPLSKQERRKLAEAEEAEYQRQQYLNRVRQNAKQGGWIALTVVLVVVLSVCLIRLI